MNTPSMNTPEAEVEITEDLVRALLREQHPDLASLPIRLVANGWDNALYRLGDELSVRLPRRELAVKLMINERRWLPVIAELVSVRVPALERFGDPGCGYPWPWAVNPWFDGVTAASAEVASRIAFAEDLATFMAQIHVPAPYDGPYNPVRGVPLAARDEVVRKRLDSGLIPRADLLREVWDELVAVPLWDAGPVWLHGDPHPANLLLDPETRRLTAVLDFGDVAIGDPAADLAVGWMAFDAEGRARFRDAAGPLGDVDEDTWARARGWALIMGAAIVLSSADAPHMAAIGTHTLEQVLVG
jgi:aminoglycoside phosphotransferase (APT) family kinase protein